MQIFSKKDFNTAKFTTILNEVENLTEKKKIISDWQASIDSGKIFQSNEQELQAEFLYKFFGEVLGYTYDLHAQERNLRREVKTHTDSTKPDGALGYFRFEENESTEDVRVVIELKDANTNLDKKQYSKNLKISPVEQAFSYAPKFSGKVKWVIVSNFVEIRLYHASDSNKYELFEIEKLLREEELARFFFLLKKDRLFLAKQESIIDSLLAEKRAEEEKITKEFYFEYRAIRELLFYHLLRDNPTKSPNDLLSCAQKLIDKVVFMAFVRDVIPMNNILGDLIRSMDYINFRDENVLWFLLKGTIRSFHKGYNHKVPRFNGGLFKPDALLESLTFREADLHELIQFVLKYDFQSQLNVNILGHIFEQSIADLEEIKANILNKKIEDKDDISLDKIKQNIISKRKSDGVFYTPEYITDFIIQKSLGFYLEQEKERLLLIHQTETEIFWKEYKKVLTEVKVLDPACGSGAFLTQVFAFLWNEWKIALKESEKVKTPATPLVNGNGKNKSKNNGKEAGFFETEENFIPEEWEIKKSIIQNNLFGVDLNPESVEITKLALWLLHANKTTPLSDLSQNVKQGNSLISDKSVHFLAFDWEKEFPFQFDVIVGNPPYVSIKMIEEKYVKYFFQHYKTAENRINLYSLFIEKSLSLLKEKGILSFVIPNSLLVNSTYLKIRELLYNGINRIVKLPDNVFEAAKVETIIFSYQNNRFFEKVRGFVFGREEKLERISLKESDYSEFDKSNWNGKNIIFNIYASNEIQAILKKCYLNSSLLEEFADISLGITPYDKYKGHSSDTIENRKFHSDKKIDASYQPLISGSNILPYYISSHISEYIRYGDWLGSAREERFFTEPRIIVRQIISGKPARIYAGYTDKALYFTQIGFSVISKNEINILYLLTIINSKLINFIHKYKFLDVEKEVFQKVLIENFRKLPIKFIFEKEQQPFISAAKKMLELQKQFHEGKNQFLELLAINFDLPKVSKKLENWHELEKKDFLAALEKQKVVIPLKKQAEFFAFFTEEKEKIIALQHKIKNLDNEINAKIYKLYNLNELEIKQIEDEYEKK